MDYVIRRANISDAEVLYSISLRSHATSYYENLVSDAQKQNFYDYYKCSAERESQFSAVMARKIIHPAWHVAVAVQGEGIIGYVIAHSKIEGKLMIRGLFVDPSKQSAGVGTALFERSLSWVKSGDSAELTVVEGNVIARSLYEKYRFEVIGEYEEDFFGAKQVIMQRPAN